MSWEPLFWDSIAKDIETKFGLGHPKNWDENVTTIFQSKMDAILKDACEKDKKKIKLCN